jgi:hypothetical protein
VTDTGQALRETSDALLRDLDVLSAIEEEKRSLEPGDPRLVDLAKRIEEIAGRVLVGSVRQRNLTEVANHAVETGSPAAPEAPIEDINRPIQAILSEWREAERRLTAARPGSADEAEARDLVVRLRDEYRRAHEAVRDR